MTRKRVLFATIPHSGERIPSETPWLVGLPEAIVMCDVDRYVDQLYEPGLKSLTLPFVKTEWHRYAVDLNRMPDDVDASTVSGHPTPAGKFNRGLHWQITTKRDVLMATPMSIELHQRLVKLYFEPFHHFVRHMVAELREKNPGAKVYHLDLHSMPSVGTTEHRDPGEMRADVVVSDNFQKSSEAWFKDLVIESYERQGFSVKYNWPYYGGRITEMYGQPQSGHHAIQVELNRKLYMDEHSKHARRELWPALMPRLNAAVKEIRNRIDSGV